MSRPFSRGPRSRQDHLAGLLDRGRPDEHADEQPQVAHELVPAFTHRHQGAQLIIEVVREVMREAKRIGVAVFAQGRRRRDRRSDWLHRAEECPAPGLFLERLPGRFQPPRHAHRPAQHLFPLAFDVSTGCAARYSWQIASTRCHCGAPGPRPLRRGDSKLVVALAHAQFDTIWL